MNCDLRFWKQFPEGLEIIGLSEHELIGEIDLIMLDGGPKSTFRELKRVEVDPGSYELIKHEPLYYSPMVRTFRNRKAGFVGFPIQDDAYFVMIEVVSFHGEVFFTEEMVKRLVGIREQILDRGFPPGITV